MAYGREGSSPSLGTRRIDENLWEIKMKRNSVITPAYIVSAIRMLSSPTCMIPEKVLFAAMSEWYEADENEVREAIEYGMMLNMLYRDRKRIYVNQEKCPAEE